MESLARAQRATAAKGAYSLSKARARLANEHSCEGMASASKRVAQFVGQPSHGACSVRAQRSLSRNASSDLQRELRRKR